jgi:hypothetical protein
LDQNNGFSSYFSAFARQSIADVWLNNIIINEEKQHIKIAGSSFNAERIPVFLQKLQNETVFKGKKFARLLMTQDDDNHQQINFSITTSTDSEEQNKL